ncbi:hypothetical protein JVW19_23100, partial [Vibrio cholerae O1]|nr:hypothetical protein [Vibrio cholerae O1]
MLIILLVKQAAYLVNQADFRASAEAAALAAEAEAVPFSLDICNVKLDCLSLVRRIQWII